jgi:hypothetical protein
MFAVQSGEQCEEFVVKTLLECLAAELQRRVRIIRGDLLCQTQFESLFVFAKVERLVFRKYGIRRF